MNDDLDTGKTKDQLIEELKEHLDIETAGRKGKGTLKERVIC